MTDFKPGEVLVPQQRFIPKCECDEPHVGWKLEAFGASTVLRLRVFCDRCKTEFEPELPYAPDGVVPER